MAAPWRYKLDAAWPDTHHSSNPVHASPCVCIPCLTSRRHSACCACCACCAPSGSRSHGYRSSRHALQWPDARVRSGWPRDARVDCNSVSRRRLQLRPTSFDHLMNHAVQAHPRACGGCLARRVQSSEHCVSRHELNRLVPSSTPPREQQGRRSLLAGCACGSSRLCCRTRPSSRSAWQTSKRATLLPAG